MKRRFIAIIEIEETFDGDGCDLACWIDHALGELHDVDSTVWSNLADFHADNVLDTLSEL